MRGRARPWRTAAAWAMRIVSSTASKVTASIALRSDRWIVTSTVRSSSLASIMRTGGAWPPCAARACSISVWPGYGTPAAASASLWIGAVTIPPACPCCTSRTACSIACRRGPAAAGVDAAERRLDQVGRAGPRPGAPAGSRAARRRSCPRSSSRATGSRPPTIAGGAPHDGDVADDERARRLAALEQPGDDLRADAGGIAHGDRQRQRRRGSHAPLSSRPSVR